MPKIELAVLEWNGRGPRLLGRLGDPDLVASVQERLASRDEAAHAGALLRKAAPRATTRAPRHDRATAAGASSGPPSSSTRRVARRAR